jgi:uncharacterized membrane protein
MMKQSVYRCLLLLSIVSINACTYQNEAELFDRAECNTTDIRYSVQVLDILQRHCYRCHQAGKPQFNSISLASYTDLKSYALDGQLVNRTNSTASPMPPSGLLSACDREAIEAWVKAGSPNN